MKILAIETSCDETSIALIEKVSDGNYREISHQTISQINIHTQYGGVFPMLARREHEHNLVPILKKVLDEAGLLKEVPERKVDYDMPHLERHEPLKELLKEFVSSHDLDVIKNEITHLAVTNGPGLPPALWVGVNFAKTLASLLNNTPLLPINHMEGHIVGALVKKEGRDVQFSKIEYPSLSLLISGGHTELVLSEKPLDYKKIGETLDDAVGEAYDKVARQLGLPYPGGPEISKLAKQGRSRTDLKVKKLPRPMIGSGDLNFSFSGLKTAVLYTIRDYKEMGNLEQSDPLPEEFIVSIATEFEEAVKDILVTKLEQAILNHNVKTVFVGGGVASNDYLGSCITNLCSNLGIHLQISDKILSTDNALMIALTAAYGLENGIAFKDAIDELTADSGLSF